MITFCAARVALIALLGLPAPAAAPSNRTGAPRSPRTAARRTRASLSSTPTASSPPRRTRIAQLPEKRDWQHADAPRRSTRTGVLSPTTRAESGPRRRASASRLSRSAPPRDRAQSRRGAVSRTGVRALQLATAWWPRRCPPRRSAGRGPARAAVGSWRGPEAAVPATCAGRRGARAEPSWRAVGVPEVATACSSAPSAVPPVPIASGSACTSVRRAARRLAPRIVVASTGGQLYRLQAPRRRSQARALSIP